MSRERMAAIFREMPRQVHCAARVRELFAESVPAVATRLQLKAPPVALLAHLLRGHSIDLEIFRDQTVGLLPKANRYERKAAVDRVSAH